MKNYIENIIRIQKENHTVFPSNKYFDVNIILKNGHIHIDGFKIIDNDEHYLYGYTKLEYYTAPRENRTPLICQIRIDDIKAINCPEYDKNIKAKA